MTALTALRNLRSQSQTVAKRQTNRVLTALRKTRQLRGSMRLTLPVTLKARSANGNCPFTGVAYTGGIFFPAITIGGRPETGAAILDLDTLRIPSQNRPVLDDHDETPDGIIGTTTVVTVRKPAYELLVKGVIYGAKDRAKPFIQAATGGHTWQMSVGTDNFTIQRIADGESVHVNGQTFEGPVTICRNAYLTDISFVAKGADDLTEAIIAANRHPQKGIQT